MAAGADETMEIGSGRRLALAPDALWLEARGSGRSWVRTRAITYPEIRAVYRYELRDWGYIGIAALYATGLLLLVLIAAAIAGWPPSVTVAACGAAAIIAGGLAAYRIAAVPRRLLRIDTFSGPLTVPNRDRLFFGALQGRVAAVRDSLLVMAESETASPTAPEGEWRVEGVELEGEARAGQPPVPPQEYALPDEAEPAQARAGEPPVPPREYAPPDEAEPAEARAGEPPVPPGGS